MKENVTIFQLKTHLLRELVDSTIFLYCFEFYSVLLVFCITFPESVVFS